MATGSSEELFSEEESRQESRSTSPEIPILGARSFYGVTPTRTAKRSAQPSTVPKVIPRKNRLFSSRLIIEKSKSKSPLGSSSGLGHCKAKVTNSAANTGTKRVLPGPRSDATQPVKKVMQQKGHVQDSETLAQPVVNDNNLSGEEDLSNQIPRWCEGYYDSGAPSKSPIHSASSEDLISDSEAETLETVTMSQHLRRSEKKRHLNKYQIVKESLEDFKCVLEKLCQKVDNNERCLKEIQSRSRAFPCNKVSKNYTGHLFTHRQALSVSSSESSSSTKKRIIPLVVRVSAESRHAPLKITRFSLDQ